MSENIVIDEAGESFKLTNTHPVFKLDLLVSDVQFILFAQALTVEAF